MINRLRQPARNEQGFTLIEFLVVILIIGILAAIAIPSFLGQRAKAQDTDAKAVVKTAQTAIEAYYTDKQTYVGADTAALRAIEPSLPATIVVEESGGGGAPTISSYRVTAISPRSADVKFSIDQSALGAVTRVCEVGGETKGGCPDGASW